MSSSRMSDEHRDPRVDAIDIDEIDVDGLQDVSGDTEREATQGALDELHAAFGGDDARDDGRGDRAGSAGENGSPQSDDDVSGWLDGPTLAATAPIPSVESEPRPANPPTPPSSPAAPDGGPGRTPALASGGRAATEVDPLTGQVRVIKIGFDHDDTASDGGIDPLLGSGGEGLNGGPVSEAGGAAASQKRIVTIDDADLPDAAYVRGSLDGGAGSIVIIDDGETADPVGAESARTARRGMDPRIRDRRTAVRKALGKRRFVWVAGFLGFALVVVAVLAVLGSNLFAVHSDRVTVVGRVYAPEVEVGSVINDLVGTPVLRVNERDVEQQLEAIPWVEQAKVTVSFPNSAKIELREREAMTTYQGPDQRYRVLDREGRVLDMLDGFPLAYVWITGPDPADLNPGEFAPPGYAAASELARNIPPGVRTRLARINVDAAGQQLSLVFKDKTVVSFGSATDLSEKLVRLQTLLSKYPELSDARLDVSTRETTRASAAVIELSQPPTARDGTSGPSPTADSTAPSAGG